MSAADRPQGFLCDPQPFPLRLLCWKVSRAGNVELRERWELSARTCKRWRDVALVLGAFGVAPEAESRLLGDGGEAAWNTDAQGIEVSISLERYDPPPQKASSSIGAGTTGANQFVAEQNGSNLNSSRPDRLSSRP